MKQLAQCQTAINKANIIIGCIRKGIQFKSEEVMLLSKIMVRPHLDYCIHFLSPCYGEDRAALERELLRVKGERGGRV